MLDSLPGLGNTDVSTKVTSSVPGGGGAGHVLQLQRQAGRPLFHRRPLRAPVIPATTKVLSAGGDRST